MIREYFSKLIPLLYVAVLFALVACNDEGKKNTTASLLVDKENTAEPPKSQLFSMSLDTLEIDIHTFKRLKEKYAVFAFRFTDSTLTMDGWKTKGNQDSLSAVPDITLVNRGQHTVLQYRHGMYLGTNVIDKVGKLTRKLDSLTATHVFFVPEVANNHIRYRIGGRGTSKENPLAAVVLDYYTNPCPPKKWDAPIDP